MCEEQELEISLKKPNVGKVYEELPLSTPHLFKNCFSTSPTLSLSDPDIKMAICTPSWPKMDIKSLLMVFVILTFQFVFGFPLFGCAAVGDREIQYKQ